MHPSRTVEPGRFTGATHAESLSCVAFLCILCRRRDCRVRALGQERITDKQMRGLAVAVLLCGASGCFHTLPVFIDAKLAADASLVGLTSETLPWSATALFAGWLIGSLSLRKSLEVLSKEQFLAASALGLFLCTLALVSLPELTAGSIWVLSLVRFVTGLLFSTGPVGNLYVQECWPERRNQAMAFINTAYSLVACLMATTCGAYQGWDWRIDALLWCGLPPLLALLLGFKDVPALLASIPSKLASRKPSVADESSSMTPIMAPALQLALCFLACGMGSYGLSYSAGKLSENLYTNSVLLNGADILGYVCVLGADLMGRKSFQCGSFLLAATSLLLCGSLPQGTWLVACALLGRIGLNVCFTTIYVALAEVFPGSCHSTVLPLCQVAARLGGLLAPFCGTLAAKVSCPVFGASCLAAAVATLCLPDRLEATLKGRVSQVAGMRKACRLAQQALTVRMPNHSAALILDVAQFGLKNM